MSFDQIRIQIQGSFAILYDQVPLGFLEITKSPIRKIRRHGRVLPDGSAVNVLEKSKLWEHEEDELRRTASTIVVRGTSLTTKSIPKISR